MRVARYGLKSRLSSTVFLVGLLLFVLGTIGLVVDLVPVLPVSGPGLELDIDLEFAGLAIGVGAVLGTHAESVLLPVSDQLPASENRRSVYITRSLFETLLDSAQEYEPESLSIGIAVTPAGRLRGSHDLPDTMPVFTHLYVPERPNSVSSVFGIDLQTPPRQVHGRFVTHPFSELALTKRDDLHEVVLVAVPPWDDESIAAFDRHGRRRPLHVLDAIPPAERLPTTNQ